MKPIPIQNTSASKGEFPKPLSTPNYSSSGELHPSLKAMVQAQPFSRHDCRCLTTDSLPWGYPEQYVRALAYAKLDGKRKRQSIYPGSDPRSLIE